MRLQKGGVGLERVVKQIVFPKGNKVKKKRVAAYARVSTGKDAMLHSLSAQVSFYSEYIQSHKDWIYGSVK
jgi:predicted site-specific integrase-resolvase